MIAFGAVIVNEAARHTGRINLCIGQQYGFRFVYFLFIKMRALPVRNKIVKIIVHQLHGKSRIRSKICGVPSVQAAAVDSLTDTDVSKSRRAACLRLEIKKKASAGV